MPLPRNKPNLLDKLAYREEQNTWKLPPIGQFWTWTRSMVIDAYYTSPAGVKDLGYMGNGAMRVAGVPQEAVDYAIQAQPLRQRRLGSEYNFCGAGVPWRAAPAPTLVKATSTLLSVYLLVFRQRLEIDSPPH